MKFNIYQFYFIILLFTLSGCEDPEKVTNGTRVIHYPNTELVMQEVEMKDGKKNGYAKEFYRNGKLKRLQFYLNDTLNDSSIYFHSNGQISNLQFFKNKRKHGAWKDFNKEGKLVKEMNFENDLLNGICTQYTYRTGRIQTKIYYKNGDKDGLEEQYYPNGKPKSKAFYKDDRPCIGLQEWQDNGKEIKNDFKISVSEKNDVMMTNMLTYYIHLSDPQTDDEVYHLYDKGTGECLGSIARLEKTEGNSFKLQFNVPKGGFVMEQVTIAAMRKTKFGNTFIKLHHFNAASNNF